MRPKPIVVLLDEDERRRGDLAYLLRIRGGIGMGGFAGYEVLEAGMAKTAEQEVGSRAHLGQQAVRVLLLAASPESDTTIRRARHADRDVRTLLLDYGAQGQAELKDGHLADAYVPMFRSGMNAVLLEKLQVLTARKRGPKTAGRQTETKEAVAV